MISFKNISKSLIESLKINRKKILYDSKLNESFGNEDKWYKFKGGNMIIRNGDVEFKFRQNSDFYWLTGIDIPNYGVGINFYQKKIILLPPAYDDMYPIWHGKIPDIEKIKNNLLFDDQIVDVFYDDKNFIVCLVDKIRNFRVIKNEFELDIISEACRISQKAHLEIKKNIELFDGMREKSVLNKFVELTENNDNVDGQAYPSICGCGENSAILHYVCTDYGYINSKIKSGEIFLIDAGCEYFNYASDITRTYGVGAINDYQQKLIDIVTDINYQCKLEVKENVNFKKIHNKCMDLIYQGILELNILNKKGLEIDKNIISKIFMPHGLGHFLGLDVHDVGGRLYNKITDESITLKENMVITIEPGIYFNKFLLEKHKDYWNDNIQNYHNLGGVRIEDVVAVKKNTYLQLNT